MLALLWSIFKETKILKQREDVSQATLEEFLMATPARQVTKLGKVQGIERLMAIYVYSDTNSNDAR